MDSGCFPEFPLPGPATRRARQKSDQKKAYKDDADNPHRSLHRVSRHRCNQRQARH